MTAMHEFVVPKSMPITFAIISSWIQKAKVLRAREVPPRHYMYKSFWHNILRYYYAIASIPCSCAICAMLSLLAGAWHTLNGTLGSDLHRQSKWDGHRVYRNDENPFCYGCIPWMFRIG
jgi:hypothetical protein